jgi:hypothetical protein
LLQNGDAINRLPQSMLIICSSNRFSDRTSWLGSWVIDRSVAIQKAEGRSSNTQRLKH